MKPSCTNNKKEVYLYLKNELLQYSDSEFEALRDEIAIMRKRNEILQNHPYAIWQSETNENWYTYILNDDKKRVLKKRTTKEKLEDFLVEFYTTKEETGKTVEEVFNEWVLRKYNTGSIELNTMQRYQQQYRESLIEFGKKRIKSVSVLDVEDCVYNAIKEKHLTEKGLNNLKTILNGTFKHARKQGLTELRTKDIFADMEISKKSLRTTKKDDEELVYLEDEVNNFKEYINARQTEGKLDLKDLGLYLLFFTGLRPGELSALKRIDIGKGVILINRTEIRYYDKVNKRNVYEVRDFPKTEAGIREVVLTKEAQEIVDKILEMNPNGTYLFEKDGKRIKSCCFDSRISIICKKIGLTTRKSMNKIRKTNASILKDSNVPDSVIIRQIGHADIETTKKHYFKNRSNLEKRRNIIEQISFVS